MRPFGIDAAEEISEELGRFGRQSLTRFGRLRGLGWLHAKPFSLWQKALFQKRDQDLRADKLLELMEGRRDRNQARNGRAHECGCAKPLIIEELQRCPERFLERRPLDIDGINLIENKVDDKPDEDEKACEPGQGRRFREDAVKD